MTTKLKRYFPMIREREEVLAKIAESSMLQERFDGWEPQQQEAFLNLCTGVKGLKFLYDGFFKEIMNPEYVPERFNDFLSCLLGRRVRVLKVLPNDSVRIAEESSLLITDIVVELEDGSIANVEMQKIGYLFPGQRCACYSADMLLRQYRRIRSEGNRKFRYCDIKSVYTVVLFEKSPKEFHAYPDTYCHYFEQKSDTGLEMVFLQKYLFVPLDIFRKSKQNKAIRSKREAWLTLLAEDRPERIAELIEAYPEFRAIYEEGYNICRNIERVMEMFSEELYELDRNTVQYMMDEMQEELDAKKRELDAKRRELDAKRRELDAKGRELDATKKEIDAQKQTIEKMRQEHDQIQREHEKLQQVYEEQLDEKCRQDIRNAVALLRDLKLPEPEIIMRICVQYQMEEEEVKEHLA